MTKVLAVATVLLLLPASGGAAVAAGAAGGVADVPPAAGVPQTGTATNATEIDSCTTIDEPGRYVLTEDLTNASASQSTGIEAANDTVRGCLVIAASDVVLEGGGHAVDGKGFADVNRDGALDANDTGTFNESERERFPIGVAVVDPAGAEATGSAANGSTLSNVTVRNLTTTDWFIGTLAADVADATISGVNATDNANVGVELLGVTDSTVSDTVAARNPFAGIYMVRSSGNTLADNTVVDNGVIGIDLFYANDDTLLRNNRISGSAVAGIAVVQSSGTRIVNETITNVTGDDSLVGFSGGIVLVSAPETGIVGSRTTDTGQWSVYATQCGAAPSVCLDAPAENYGEPSRVIALNLSIDGTPVDFLGENVAIGAAAEGGDGRRVGDGLVVTNTTDNASITLRTQWGDGGGETDAGGDRLGDGDRTDDDETASE